MSREERQLLLHEGSGVTSTMSAYVEIIFDNSDHRFPTGKDEVIIRRTIGLKKDEYSLDKKSSSKADVMNLLESAGFSKSNPYYIVPQGRITSLTNAKDHERLALLKEVAGTKVYENRRSESEKIIEETESKQAKIDELLAYIEQRLEELESEKEELKEFQQNDKERRCLEYALHSRELQEVTAALEEVEEERQQENYNNKERREATAKREKSIQALELRIKEKKQEQAVLLVNKRELEAELSQLVKSKTEVECLVSDLQSNESQSLGQKKALESQLKKIRKALQAKEVEMMELEPECATAQEREQEARQTLDATNARLQTLYSKQGRLRQFATAAERDSFLQSEIKSIKEFLKRQSQALDDLRGLAQQTQDQISALEAQEGELQNALNTRQEQLRELEAVISSHKDLKAEKEERRKELWREEAKLGTTLGHARDELRTAERNLASMMDKDTANGLMAVDRIAERLGLKGVYGPLYRLFTVKSRLYNTPVELTAGTSLFHVVVDTDETASRVLKAMLEEKAGRVTFMPLNRLKVKAVQYPEVDEVEPLIKQLEYNPLYEKALQQVFGKTCICKDLATAAKYARSHDLNTTTIEGDKVDRKGALTGGYHDLKRSRMDGINAYKHWKAKHVEESERSIKLKAEITPLEQEITQISGRIQVDSNERMRLLDARGPLLRNLSAIQREKDQVEAKYQRQTAEIRELETEIANLQAQVKSHSDEIGAPMSNNLNPRERKELQDLVKQVDGLKSSYAERKAIAAEMKHKKDMLEIELNEDLRKKRDELEGLLERAMDAPLVDASDVANLESRQRELATLQSSLDRLSQELQAEEDKAEKIAASIAADVKELEKENQAQRDDGKALSKEQKLAERYLAKRQMLSARKEECNRNIRDLGLLPEEAFEKYIKEKSEKLLKKLTVVNEKLKKYGHVNKKAFEQYSNFTKQREQLQTRRQDLEASAKSIQMLMETLDQRKDEAIERTFKQVSKYFEEVFEKLVPAGRGRLIMQRNIDETQDVDMDEDVAALDRYTGVAIKVSFNSKSDEGLRIQQLSGGQKSLVALATVFAIQKCDPAPFYLFDEIDANLDAQYRTSVATMIHELSSTAQFITTTFRPEMLQRADKFFGVMFDNQKVSSISTIGREDAVEFIENETLAQ
ncbi:Structural maintenance of chromosomes protein 3 AltName: Full=Cohesin complex Psm3 subunit [Serendipita indica DSM 11827]|nr:Structural maintenance of chromosomes protein 3 AltName: Full=Cohesin complex Psm3 subunit [Serendipita indica DSM 11827]